jgi:hypothetical protein
MIQFRFSTVFTSFIFGIFVGHLKNNCLSAMSLTNYVLIWSGFSLCFTMFKFYSSLTINWPNLNLCYNLKPFVLLSQEFLPETGPWVPADESPSTQCRWPLPPQGAVEVRNSQNYFKALARLATRFFDILYAFDCSFRI